jgi:hypothetical protein
MVQSRCGNKGKFELVTPMASGGLAHYWRDNDDPALPWHGPRVFGQELGIVGSVSFIERKFGNPGNLEIVTGVGTTIEFLWRDSGTAFIRNGPTHQSQPAGSARYSFRAVSAQWETSRY